MNYRNDAEAMAYVHRQLLNVRDLPGGPFYAHIRPQWRYRDLPSHEMDIGHLEWKIYHAADVWVPATRSFLEDAIDKTLQQKVRGQAEVGIIGGKEPSADSDSETNYLFAYWAMRITSDYRFFSFIHSNSSAGAHDTDQDFEHGSLLACGNVTEDGENSLAHYVEDILTNYDANRYYLS